MLVPRAMKGKQRPGGLPSCIVVCQFLRVQHVFTKELSMPHPSNVAALPETDPCNKLLMHRLLDMWELGWVSDIAILSLRAYHCQAILRQQQGGSYPRGCIVIQLLPTMVVEEAHVRGRQCFGQHDPTVTQLGSREAHESCVAVLPARWRQQLPHQLGSFCLVAAPHQQSDAAKQNVQCQAVMPRLCTAPRDVILSWGLCWSVIVKL